MHLSSRPVKRFFLEHPNVHEQNFLARCTLMQTNKYKYMVLYAHLCVWLLLRPCILSWQTFVQNTRIYATKLMSFLCDVWSITTLQMRATSNADVTSRCSRCSFTTAVTAVCATTSVLHCVYMSVCMNVRTYKENSRTKTTCRTIYPYYVLLATITRVFTQS